VGVAFALLAAQVAVAVGAPETQVGALAERQDATMPDAIRQVVGMDDRSAIVIGVSTQRLRHIGSDGRVAVMEHPEIGTIAWVSAHGQELWVLGEQGLLHREAGIWRRLELSKRVNDPERLPTVAAVGPGHALVVRTVAEAHEGRGTEIVHVRPDGNQPFWFPGVTLTSVVAGTDGVIWALMETISTGGPTGDRLRGYLRFSGGRWTLWELGGSEGEPFDGIETRVAPTRAPLQQLVADGRGGAYGIRFDPDAIFHIDAGGGVESVNVSLPSGDGRLRMLAIDESGKLLIIDMAQGRRVLIRIARVEQNGSVELVPIPAWYASADYRPDLKPATTSVAGGVLWLSTQPMVFSKVDDTWMAYLSPAVQDGIRARTRRAQRSRWVDPLRAYGPAALTLSVGLAAGSYGASEAGDVRLGVGGLEVVAGAAAGLLPLYLAQEGAPWNTDRNPMNVWGFLVGVPTAPLLTGLATWGTGELLDGSEHRGAAFLGAQGGALVGLAVALTASRLTRDASPRIRRVANALGIAALGSGAALGYGLFGR
jgi:hypothetical protein